MSTLTDRYISEVVRRLPEDQRGDISAEIAATIDDMVAARLDAVGGGAVVSAPDSTGPDPADPGPADPDSADPDSAERAVLARLGDPAELARRYAGSRQYLIGPDVYPVWLRVLRWLMPIAGVIAAAAGGILYVSTTPDAALGGLIGEAVSAVAGALMWVFTAWTLVVVIIERSTPEGGRNPLGAISRWDPVELDRAPARTEPRIEAAVSLLLLALLAAIPFVPSTFLYIGHLNDGEPLVNPDIPTAWLAGYLLLIGVLAALQLWRLARSGSSRGLLAVEVVIDVVFGAFLTVLVLSQDSVIHPDIIASGQGDLSTTAIRWSVILTIWAIVIWDQVETVRAHRREAAATLREAAASL